MGAALDPLLAASYQPCWILLKYWLALRLNPLLQVTGYQLHLISGSHRYSLRIYSSPHLGLKVAVDLTAIKHYLILLSTCSNFCLMIERQFSGQNFASGCVAPLLVATTISLIASCFLIWANRICHCLWIVIVSPPGYNQNGSYSIRAAWISDGTTSS